MTRSRHALSPIWLLVLLLTALPACSSGSKVRTQEYARLSEKRQFEYELPIVWRGIENALHGYKITKREPSEVNEVQLKHLTRRKLETDWIYSESKTRYQEYRSNDTPRKKYLLTRFKYEITAQSVMGGTDVSVVTDEEVEKLKDDGTTESWERMDRADSSRGNEIIDRINLAILSAAP
jgi:hypothetical protein